MDGASPLLAFLLLAVPASGHPQEGAAEVALGKIGQSIRNAKTVRVAFRAELVASAAGAEMKTKASGTLLLGEGNRVFLSLKGFHDPDRGAMDLRVISDGSKLRVDIQGNPGLERTDPPVDLRGSFGEAFTRGGLAHPLTMLIGKTGHTPRVLQESLGGFGRWLDLSELRQEPDDATGTSLGFVLKDPRAKEDPPLRCRLWYDRVTHRPLRRSWSWSAGGVRYEATETCEEVVLDAALPDDAFQLVVKGVEPEELLVLAGPAEPVGCLAFSPNGKILASGGGDASVRLWDAASGRELRALPDHRLGVRALRFASDGTSLTTVSGDHTITVWNPADGGTLRTFRGPEVKEPAKKRGAGILPIEPAARTTCVSFSPDGKTLAFGGTDRAIVLWDVEAGVELRKLVGHRNGITSVQFSPDGRMLASGSVDATVGLWDVAGGNLMRTLAGHPNSISSVAFSPDGKTVAAGCSVSPLLTWDAADGRALLAAPGRSGDVGVVFSPDGKTLASAIFGQVILLRDANDGKDRWRLAGHPGRIRVLAFSPDGKRLATGGEDRKIRIWGVKE